MGISELRCFSRGIHTARFTLGKIWIHPKSPLNLGSLPLAETAVTPTGLPWECSSMCLFSVEPAFVSFFFALLFPMLPMHYLLPSKYFLLDCFVRFQNPLSPAFWPSRFLYSFTAVKTKLLMVWTLFQTSGIADQNHHSWKEKVGEKRSKSTSREASLTLWVQSQTYSHLQQALRVHAHSCKLKLDFLWPKNSQKKWSTWAYTSTGQMLPGLCRLPCCRKQNHSIYVF